MAFRLASGVENGEITGDICVKLSGCRDGGKIALASNLQGTGVPYTWIAQKLGLGSADTLRVRVHRYRKRRNT